MPTYQRILNVVWVVLGAAIAVYADGFGVWQAGGPSSGFMPLLAGILICGLGALQLVQTARGGSAEVAAEPTFFPDRGAARRVLCVIAALIAVALLMEPLGFVLTAFLVTLFLLTIIEFRGWLVTLAVALTASVGVWWLFTKLDVLLPGGPWGF